MLVPDRSGFRRRALLLLAAAFLGPAGCAAADAPLPLAPERSLLAVVTHKAGPAARLAHNHLVVAGDDPPAVEFSPREPAATRFDVEVRVENLRIDEAALQERWYPRLAELGILAEPFEHPSEGDLGKIRKAMLSEEQLDFAGHPTLRARLVGVREAPSKLGDVAFTHTVDVTWTIRGVTVERPAAARWEESSDSVVLEAVGTLRFTDFGIEPYSAVLGAVRNADEFHVYLQLVGKID